MITKDKQETRKRTMRYVAVDHPTCRHGAGLFAVQHNTTHSRSKIAAENYWFESVRCMPCAYSVLFLIFMAQQTCEICRWINAVCKFIFRRKFTKMYHVTFCTLNRCLIAMTMFFCFFFFLLLFLFKKSLRLCQYAVHHNWNLHRHF